MNLICIKQQLYKVEGPVNLARLLSNFKRPHLRYDAHIPVIPKSVEKTESMFSCNAETGYFTTSSV